MLNIKQIRTGAHGGCEKRTSSIALWTPNGKPFRDSHEGKWRKIVSPISLLQGRSDGMWGFFGGSSNRKPNREKPIDAAKREFFEEAGFEFPEDIQLTPLSSHVCERRRGGRPRVAHAFEARVNDFDHFLEIVNCANKHITTVMHETHATKMVPIIVEPGIPDFLPAAMQMPMIPPTELQIMALIGKHQLLSPQIMMFLAGLIAQKQPVPMFNPAFEYTPLG